MLRADKPLDRILLHRISAGGDFLDEHYSRYSAHEKTRLKRIKSFNSAAVKAPSCAAMGFIHLSAAFIWALFTPAVHAQHSLIVFRGNGIPGLVKAAILGGDGAQAEVANWDDTSIHPIPEGVRFSLASASVWAPGIIDVSNLIVEIKSGDEALRVHGYLKSDTTLPNCVIVIVAKSPAMKVVPAHDDLKIYPIPPAAGQTMMPADKSVAFDHRWDLGSRFDYAHGTWELHLFSNGEEVPTTLMKAEEISAARAKTDAYLLRDHPIALLLGVPPQYPEELKSRNISGSATVRGTVGRCGLIKAIEIVSATQPAFGEAAAEAVKQWLFAPAVRDHHAVEQLVEFPVNFRAPNAVR
jgi:TonB family protein